MAEPARSNDFNARFHLPGLRRTCSEEPVCAFNEYDAVPGFSDESGDLVADSGRLGPQRMGNENEVCHDLCRAD